MRLSTVFSGIILFCLSSVLLAQFDGGDGSIGDPYRIETAEHFIELANDSDYWSSSFILVNDIDLAGYDGLNGSPLYGIIAADTDAGSPGFQGTAFTGTFDGNGKKIVNLRIDGANKDYVGLFGNIGFGGSISNLEIIDAVVSVGHDRAGILAGQSSGSIIDCKVSGSIDGYQYVGGMVGYNEVGSLERCQSDVDVVGKYYLGGMVGYNNSGSLANCQAGGIDTSVTGLDSSTHLGGLVGYNKGNITGSSSQCDVIGGVNSSYLGGLVGYSLHCDLIQCFATGDVSAGANSSYTGGLAGYCNTVNLTQCYSQNDVVEDSTIIYAGGFIAYGLSCNINSCYSWGDVTGGNFVGGFMGYNDFGTIYKCYSSGSVSGTGFAGGLLGCNKYGTVKYCLWDSELATEVNLNIGADIGGTLLDIYGKTTMEMQDYVTFAKVRFDFDKMTHNGTEDLWVRNFENLLPVFTWQDDAILFGGGSGTEQDPFIIATAKQLYRIVDYKWEYMDAYYRMVADIDMAEYDGLDGRKPFRIIGDNSYFSGQYLGASHVSGFYYIFSGIFDGDGYVIKNLVINEPDKDYVGMFGVTGVDCLIKNLELDNCQIVGRDNVAALIGYNKGLVSNCRVNADMISRSNSGILVGDNYGGDIEKCCSNGSVQVSSGNAGGLVGLNSGSIDQCFSTSSVEVVANGYYYGGLVGNSSGTIENCYATGSVNGHYHVGGLTGTSGGSILNCYATGLIDGNNNSVGFSGSLYGVYENCYWDKVSSGKENGVGNINPDPAAVMGFATEQMMVKDTYDGFDFIGDGDGDEEIWVIQPGNSYPKLTWYKDVAGDLAGQYGVDIIDVSVFLECWLLTASDQGWDSHCDFDESGRVDLGDLAILAGNWLR
ncbi:MAG: hypothetical protein JEZ07_05950 [Phycisphaerae bacterium]|nr:hypothetical protein [Phycisphaerae bacterium]